MNFIVTGGQVLKGEVTVAGAKNMVLPALVAGLLTDEKVTLSNVPLISDLKLMMEITKSLGAQIEILDHTLTVGVNNFKNHRISLEQAAKLRTSFMMIVPLLVRLGKASIPNPGGCRIGARPVERIVEGLRALGVKLNYNRNDGYFHAECAKLRGGNFIFPKNSHTGTEIMILAGSLAEGETVLDNAAEEPEVDDLILLLNKMGAKIKRNKRKIVIAGVKKLKGAIHHVMSDRNEAVTFGVAAYLTKGNIFVKGARSEHLKAFLATVKRAGGGYEIQKEGVRFFYKKDLKSVDVTTAPYPGFMTDWQAPWTVLMSQARGLATVHETVYENRFQYVQELLKMGASISFFKPKVADPQSLYNFNLEDDKPDFPHGLKIKGPTTLHNAVLTIPDLRAGATLVLAALVAQGKSYISGVELLDRGYEKFEERLAKLGAKIRRD